MSAPIVFFDIAGPDPSLKDFYVRLFHWEVAEDGRFQTSVVSPLGATFRQDPAEKMLYVGVEDVAATLAQAESLGGTVDAPRFEVPGVVVLGLFRDPAGNRMGLVEMRDGRPVVP